MELKVTVGGVERVVCGATATTTCHQVIIALAQATGRTGRFTLVERWAGRIERPLAPTDRPLALLQSKWNGQYASSGGEVEFVLRRSEDIVAMPPDYNGGQDGNSAETVHSSADLGRASVARGGELPQAVTIRKTAKMLVRKSLSFSGAHHRGDVQAGIWSDKKKRDRDSGLGLRLRRGPDGVEEESEEQPTSPVSEAKHPDAFDGRPTITDALDGAHLPEGTQRPPPPLVRPAITPRTSVRKSKGQGRTNQAQGQAQGRNQPIQAHSLPVQGGDNLRDSGRGRGPGPIKPKPRGTTFQRGLVMDSTAKDVSDGKGKSELVLKVEKNEETLRDQEKCLAQLENEIRLALDREEAERVELAAIERQLEDYERLSTELSAEELAYPSDDADDGSKELARLEKIGHQHQKEIEEVKVALENTEDKLASCEGMMETRLKDQINTALRQLDAMGISHNSGVDSNKISERITQNLMGQSGPEDDIRLLEAELHREKAELEYELANERRVEEEAGMAGEELRLLEAEIRRGEAELEGWLERERMMGGMDGEVMVDGGQQVGVNFPSGQGRGRMDCNGRHMVEYRAITGKLGMSLSRDLSNERQDIWV